MSSSSDQPNSEHHSIATTASADTSTPLPSFSTAGYHGNTSDEERFRADQFASYLMAQHSLLGAMANMTPEGHVANMASTLEQLGAATEKRKDTSSEQPKGDVLSLAKTLDFPTTSSSEVPAIGAQSTTGSSTSSLPAGLSSMPFFPGVLPGFSPVVSLPTQVSPVSMVSSLSSTRASPVSMATDLTSTTTMQHPVVAMTTATTVSKETPAMQGSTKSSSSEQESLIAGNMASVSTALSSAPSVKEPLKIPMHPEVPEALQLQELYRQANPISMATTEDLTKQPPYLPADSNMAALLASKIEASNSNGKTLDSDTNTNKSNIDDEDEDDEEEDDDDDADDDEDDAECLTRLGLDHLSARQRAHHAITGRGVTLAMLMADGVIQPGPNTMSIDYLGQKFTADLLEDGSIRWREANKLFQSPSAWAIHCKKIVNPMKKSGCGWASVRYKGKKLDAYKSSWLRKKRPLAMAAVAAVAGSEEDGEESDSKSDSKRMKFDDDASETADSVVQAPIHPPPPVTSVVNIKPERKRLSVKHASLGRKSFMHDPSTLVECTPFAALGKIQPFSLSISNTALLSMDFHCHLSSSEIVGYLGGKWDPQTQHLSIERSFACLSRLDDKENGPLVEKTIRADMERAGLTLAGWYHSHPLTQPDPSLRDLEAQMDYQIRMKGPGESIQPCVAIIISPYSSEAPGQEESDVRAVWIMAPPEHRPLDYGMPMRICYDITEDQGIPKHLLPDMRRQAEFHRRQPEAINFHDSWHSSGTYHNKLKASLSRKLPQDQQIDKQLLDFLNTLL